MTFSQLQECGISLKFNRKPGFDEALEFFFRKFCKRFFSENAEKNFRKILTKSRKHLQACFILLSDFCRNWYWHFLRPPSEFIHKNSQLFITDSLSKLESLTTPSRGNSSVKMPAEVSSNKNDKWKADNPLKRLLSSNLQPHQAINSNNYSRNSSIMTRPLSSHHQGPKKTDAPMLNLVYDSHIKNRYPDFR